MLDAYAEHIKPLNKHARKLVEANQGLIRLMVDKVLAAVLPGTLNVEYDDLVNYAQFPLMRAAQKFEPARGVKFSTVACAYIYRFFWGLVRSEKGVRHCGVQTQLLGGGDTYEEGPEEDARAVAAAPEGPDLNKLISVQDFVNSLRPLARRALRANYGLRQLTTHDKPTKADRAHLRRTRKSGRILETFRTRDHTRFVIARAKERLAEVR